MKPATRLLGVDFGAVRVGLAVSDPDRKFAFPLATYTRQGRDRDAAYFRALVGEEEVAGLVVGLPVHTGGQEGIKAAEARAFGRWLADVCALPVVFYDERFTTVEAEAALQAAGLTHKKRKARRDRVAAQIFLQAYLDAGCPAESSTLPLTGPSEDPPAAEEQPAPERPLLRLVRTGELVVRHAFPYSNLAGLTHGERHQVLLLTTRAIKSPSVPSLESHCDRVP